MKPVTINKELCIGCGKCVRDCVSEKLKLVDGKAEFLYERCIECGHCYAVCPTNAVSMNNYICTEETPVSPTVVDSDLLLSVMKSRRSIRQFTKDPISDEAVEKIIEAGRYCPTGTNSQDFSFTVLRNGIGEIEKECVKFFRTAQKLAVPFSSYIKNTTIDDNFFFKGSGCVIIVSGKSKTNACLASSYMELMAQSMGIGVLYSGFFVAAAKLSKKVSSSLKLQKDHTPMTCLVLGYPDVKYQRIPPRKEPRVTIV